MSAEYETQTNGTPDDDGKGALSKNKDSRLAGALKRLRHLTTNGGSAKDS